MARHISSSQKRRRPMIGGVTLPATGAPRCLDGAQHNRGVKAGFFISGMVNAPVVPCSAMGEPEIHPRRSRGDQPTPLHAARVTGRHKWEARSE